MSKFSGLFSALPLSFVAVLLVASTANAGDLDKLKSKVDKKAVKESLMEEVSLPSLGSDSVGSAAGVLEYCVKNNYLGGGDAEGIKDKLLGKITGQEEQEKAYESGLAGLLGGSDGKSFDLSKVSDKLKTKACDYVLENATNLL